MTGKKRRRAQGTASVRDQDGSVYLMMISGPIRAFGTTVDSHGM
jgi:hypothetical protein